MNQKCVHIIMIIEFHGSNFFVNNRLLISHRTSSMLLVAKVGGEKMKVDIDTWMKEYFGKLKNLFGSRLEFVGLQGSYGRGEATDDSDIDVVVILNHADAEDLKAYGTMLDSLPNREKVCGFISSLQKLKHWEHSDLFQFYYDTTPIFGSIDFLQELIGKEDVRRAIRIGACNLYHMCGHNMVHERDGELLKALYKSATFTVQAISYLQTGTYRKRKTELLPVLRQPEREILETAIAMKQQVDLAQAEFDRLSKQLFRWASDLIAEYQSDETQAHTGTGCCDA
nr:nucleotidyltransferase domain-containing protein [uncultured Bacillus sp.]